MVLRTKRDIEYVRETYAWCSSCQQLLRHDRRYCPLFPDAPPQRWYGVEEPKKWSACCCMTHTCYVNLLKLVYVGFLHGGTEHYGWLGDHRTLCGRVPVLIGLPITEPFKEGTCGRCMAAFFKRARVYCDRP